MSFHTIIIVGNLGKDPEMRYVPNGSAVTSFSVASNRQYTDSNGQKVKETTWFNVSVWGKQAENVNTYLQKGSTVLIEGELRPDKETGSPRTYTRSDGSTGASYDINARTVRFLSSKGSSTDGFADSGGGDGDEDIPF
ncbi:MAG: single-stranded DNA-binding protein [Pelolinea sp.]|nr:single-stranded DNA-binding protein [Pelolinea sp.]